LKLVESAGRKHLFMSSMFDPLQVGNGKQDSQLCSFLQQCKQIYQHRVNRSGAGLGRSSSYKERVSVSSGGREAREAAHVEARSYEGLQAKKTESGASRKKYPDLYVHGASSVTDLSSRRAEHENMLHGGTRGFSKQSSGSSESLDLYAPFMGNLDRVQSMESGISHQHSKPRKGQTNDLSVNLPRSASQGNLPPATYPSHLPPHRPHSKSLARSTESFHAQTLAGRRTPSYVQLSNTSTEEWSEQLNALEERVGILASRFLYERQDMFKQILRACKSMVCISVFIAVYACPPACLPAVVKERKKRQLAEQRIESLEKTSRQLVQYYDLRFIELAKQVSNT
jgi:hypothetical protein